MKLRVKFRKFGSVRFIGHLDVMRFFQKAIRRAGIDIAYTGGYSPHQIMTFAAPLGVGLESNGEYMDIEVHSLPSCQEVADRLNQVSVPGIQVVSVKILPEKAGNAMASVAAAAYTIRVREETTLLPDMAAILPDFLVRKEIRITKETKKGTREVDIRPGILALDFSDGDFHLLVDASSAGNIKPEQVMTALLSQAQGKVDAEVPCVESFPGNALRITREDVYTRAMSDNVTESTGGMTSALESHSTENAEFCKKLQEHGLISLGDVGYTE